MGQSSIETPIHFIDFEGNATSGIIEFGVVTLQAGEINATHTRLCAALGRVRPEETAVHGLDAPALAGSAPFKDEWEYFAGLRASGPLAAHFAQAENHLLKSVWAYPWIDTGRLYPQFFPALGDGKLEELITAVGLQAELDAAATAHCPMNRRHYHAALYDALAGALLLRSLLQRTEMKEATIPWLLQMSTLDGDKRDALQQDDLF